ncbi:MAG TPA: LPS export ABC transporter permease LptG [Parvularculaceae bacterium]|nr:LPS export ABC transporter permease LptG [Parvularculaceae bacterium]
MMPSGTLFRYIALKTVFAVAALMLALAALAALADLVESLRFIDKFGGDFGSAVVITLLRTPSIVQVMLPFIFLFAAIWLFSELNRRAEVAVMRSAGLSVWRLLWPAGLVAIMAGFLVIFVTDPLATRLLAQSESVKDHLSGQASSAMRVFGDGIWLRQTESQSILIINARSFDRAHSAFSRIVIWRLGADSTLLERIDAPEALLSGHTIELHDARVRSMTGEAAERQTPVYAIDTALIPADLDERAKPPETVPLWRIPHYMALAKAAGLSTRRYAIRFHDLCSTPLKLLAMVLIAAMFSLRPVRQGGALKLFLFAVGAGFALYVLSQVAAALGESGVAPVALAAWAPAVAVSLAAITGLLHLEEG